MATLQATLVLYDRFSAGLRQVNKALEQTIKLTDKLQAKLGKPLDVRIRTDSASRQLNSVQKRIIAMNKSNLVLNGVRIRIDGAALRSQIQAALDSGPFKIKLATDVSSSGSGASSPGKGLGSALKGAYDAIAPIFKESVGGAMERKRQIDAYSARAGSDTGGQVIFDAVNKQALKANYDPAEAHKSAMSMIGTTTDPAMLTALNGIAMRMQKLSPSKNLESATGSLKGLMTGDPKAFLESSGISQKNLDDSGAMKKAAEGDLTGFLASMDSLLSKQGMSQESFEKGTNSPAAQVEGFKQHINDGKAQAGMPALEALMPTLDKLSEAFNAGRFDPFFEALSAGLWVVAELLSLAADAAFFLLDVFTNNGDAVIAIIAGLGAVAIPMMIGQLWAMLPALWAMVAPVLSTAAAWLAMNWPILLIIAVIGGLVYIMLSMGATVGEIIGGVIGAFYMLGGAIYNIIAACWNLFASFADFIINLFVDPVFTVQKLFYDLATFFGNAMYQMLYGAETFAGGFMKVILEGINVVLDGFNGLLGLYNKLTGSDIKPVDPFKTDNIHAISDKYKDLMGKYLKEPEGKSKKYLPRMDMANLQDLNKKGMDTGINLTGKVAKFAGSFDFSAGPKDADKYKGVTNFPPQDKNGAQAKTEALTGFGAAGKGGIGTIDKVGEVGSIKDEVNIGSEDLKVMRDMAEIKALQNFVTLTPTVQVTTGPVMKEMDVDQIIGKIDAYMVQELSASAQGSFGV